MRSNLQFLVVGLVVCMGGVTGAAEDVFRYNEFSGKCESSSGSGQVGLNAVDRSVFPGRDRDSAPLWIRNGECSDFTTIHFFNVNFEGNFNGSDFSGVKLSGYPGVYLGTKDDPISLKGAKLSDLTWDVGFNYNTICAMKNQRTQISFAQKLDPFACRFSEDRILCFLSQ